jgi:hypothetical protein
MRYEKGMKRYSKAGGSYKEDSEGSYYKGGDGKMYKMSAPKGMDKPGNKPGQADDHAHEQEDENADYPGSSDKGGKAKKSMAGVTDEDLQKTLDEIEDLYKAGDPAERKKQLLQKAQEGDLTDDENEELLKALRGGDVADDEVEFSESLAKGFQSNDGLQKALDVSEYLDEQHTELVKALTDVGKHVENEGRRQHDFNLVLAKAIHQVGTLVKGMSERLGVIETQPARAPKSRGVRVPQGQAALSKSFGGADGSAPGGGEQISRDEILDTMVDMMEKSHGGTAACGEDILQATAKFEQTGQMSKAMAAEVIEFRKQSAH